MLKMTEEKKFINQEPKLLNYRSYRKRWLVLSVVVILNISGAMVWLTFTPVAYKAARFYGTNLGTINWLSIIFNLSGILLGFAATYVLEVYGLRTALYVAGFLTFIGATLRASSVIESISSEERLALLFVGQSLVAIGQPFSIYSPAKTASTWFPENERAIANTIGTIANPIGVVIIGLISPLFVNYNNGEFDAKNLLIAIACPAGLGLLMTLVVMKSGEPLIPPSAGGVKNEIYFGNGIKRIILNKTYMILVVTVGSSVGLYAAYATLLEQLLCPFGYSDSMAGMCSATITSCGVVGAAITGVYCDHSKQFATTIKSCYVASTIGMIVFACVFQINMGHLILIVVGAIGLSSFGIFPIGIELGAEATYPVGVATSSGLIQISGQIQAIILILVLQVIGRPMSSEEVLKNDAKCHSVTSYNATFADRSIIAAGNTTTNDLPTVTYDLSLSVYVCTGYMIMMVILLLGFFRPVYRRMIAERPHTQALPEASSRVLQIY